MSNHTLSRSPDIQPSSAPAPARTVSESEIAKRAYEKYEARGRVDGFALEDWLAASRELAGAPFGRVGLPSQDPRSP